MRDDDLLLDYLLHQLPDAEARALEHRLERHPTLAARLERLRRRLRPLEQLRSVPCTPPRGLAERTLARLRNLPLPFSLSLPRAPRVLPELRTVGGRFCPDVLVACCLLFVVGGLLASALGKLRARQDWLACQNFWRQWYVQRDVPAGFAFQASHAPFAEPEQFPTYCTLSENRLPRWSPLSEGPPIDSQSSHHAPLLYRFYLAPFHLNAEDATTSSVIPNRVLHVWVPDFPSRDALPLACDAGRLHIGALESPHPYGFHILCAGGHVQVVTPVVFMSRAEISSSLCCFYRSGVTPE